MPHADVERGVSTVRAFRGMRKFNKYKENLRQHGNKIWSYSTHVATIKGDELHQLGWWSVTTQKHINYAAKELGLELIK
jgi:hypothetical protein